MKKFYFNLVLSYCLLLFGFQCVNAQNPPTGFASVTVSNQWNEAVGLTFSEDGTEMFVWERGGKVWVVKSGQKQLLLDISPEVGGWHDLGMLGFALHPDFNQNGYFYVFYIVDRHHLINFGTGAYNPATNDYFSATIGRLTRYTATKNGNSYNVNPASRTILLGATKSTGLPQLSPTHGVGSLVFGTDKTLLLSTGDGASPNGNDAGSFPDSYYVQALADGIIRPEENVGAFRSQMLTSLNGKVLRIDPETGEGIPSNPYYDPANPNANISKVWALGLRNPFRMDIKPGTGSHNPAEGNPGILYFGDVGWFQIEDLSVVDGPAQNFGWPLFEGLTTCPALAPINTPNYDAPNPLYQVNGCTQQYFYFQDLLKQETPSGTATFTNPCDGSPIPASIPTFVHRRPLIDWHHTALQARTGTFNGTTATVANIGSAGSPVSGPQFKGSASVGGVFYTGTDFPAEYQNTYFFGDYSGGWIRNLTVDANDKPVAVKDFVTQNAIVVGMKTHPTEEGLFYINFPSEIKKIIYSSNRPPVALASVNNNFGPAPLNVQFTGSGSTDFEGQPLLYQWNFGDGSPLSTSQNPTHSFTAPPGIPTKYTITLKVTDNLGATDQTSIDISVNNTPPQVAITSPVNNSLYSLSQETTYPLQATVTDQEHNMGQLTYAWQSFLHHESHQHPNPIDNSPTSSMVTEPVGCDGETYFYRIVLTVTDPAGASTTREVRLYPDCGNEKITPFITWANPADIVTGTALSATQLNATATHNGTPVPGVFTYTPPSGTVLPTGAGQQLSVSFAPTDTDLYNSASKIVAIDVNPPTGSATFYRAINLNGPALTIDGNNWQASAGAPNFTYTTNQWAFTDPTVPLIPATDANRTNMIRSSIWGNVNLTVSAVPAATYQVYVYVWEDNSPALFSITLEGNVVLANHNSGPAGTWSKLGPFQATINDGAINVSSTGNTANLSGLEIWSTGPPTGNQPPFVSNPIMDQNATVGTAFTFTFPSNTFTDPNAGTTLTYAATLSSGAALPAWLNFNAGTRNFSGTPASGNTGTLDIRVTASDGAGGSISDVFALAVNPPNGSAAFYRAINLNGPALTIDGNNWQASAGAPNFTYTTNQWAFTDPTVPLIPATDANRSTMIHSSIWGNVNLTVSAVPAATYQVYVYVWEDNSPAVFSITLEGIVVRANHNSGPAGTWSKLGPFQATINDGAINVSSTGNTANLSGLEIWSTGPPTGNQPPFVSNPIVDQSATVGTAFTFTFPSNTFTDPNAGTTLTYAATLSSGAALPAWLNFNAGTRNFSGTPASGNTGTLDIRVTASDGAGGSISDVFALAVNPPTGSATFYRAINLNGPALTIDGNNWQASAGAPNFTYTTNQWAFTDPTVPLIPATDANRTNMIRSSIWGNVNLTVSAVPAATYQVYVYVWEDNSPALFSITLEGNVVLANHNSGPAGTWSKLGPFQATINDGAINVSSTGNTANLSGLEIWSTGPPTGNQPPFVSNPIMDQNATVGTAFTFTFPSNTFTDPNAGTTLTYAATLSSGAALPAWLNFNASTRNFSGTPASGNTGTLDIRVTASDGAGGSISDVFALAVNPPSGSATFYRAINLNGPALTIDGNNWQASAGAPNFTYTTNQWAFTDQTVPLIPATDANRTTMIHSSIWGNVNLTVSAVPAGTYQVYVYVWEDNSPAVFSITLEGIVVRANHNSGPAGTWSKLGPFQATINDGAINVSSTGNTANLSGLEIWTAGQQANGRVAFGNEKEAENQTQAEADDNLDSEVLSAYPNPFSGKVNVTFTAKKPGATQLAMFDTRGVRVRVLFEDVLSEGKTEKLEVEADGMVDGVYILRLANGGEVKHFKLILTR